MAVRKLRAKQRGPRCSYCSERAIWRGLMFSKFACDEHLPELRAWDAKASQPDYSDAAFIGGFS